MSMLSERLKQLREKNKLKQDEVAQELGISLSSYRKYEYGDRDPSLDILREIAFMYSVSTDYLLGLNNIENKLSELSFEVVISKSEALSSGMLYEMLKNKEGEESATVRNAKDRYSIAEGLYRKKLYEYMIEYFNQLNPNPNNDYLLKDKFPLVFSTDTDLFDGINVYVKCNDGTDLGAVKYFAGAIPERAIEKAERYIKKYRRHFEIN